jgi:AraC-like DNA-binding protein
MKIQSRRAGTAARREVRLFDATTFARLRRARDYLGACYPERITLENAARHACLSPFHFSRVFTHSGKPRTNL